jgi:hypothetical protein
MDQETLARSKFRETLVRNPSIQLDPHDFSPQVLRVFESTRQDLVRERAAAAPPPKTAGAASGGGKHSALPYILIGGAAAAAGIAVAVAGGGSSSSATTTPATTTATTTTTTTLTSSCSFKATPTLDSFKSKGGDGSCRFATSDGCSWTSESTAGWIVITSGMTGTGSGQTHYHVDANHGGDRKGHVRLVQHPEIRCEIDQSKDNGNGNGQSQEASGDTATLVAELSLPGGQIQLVANGLVAAYLGAGASFTLAALSHGDNRVEATVVAAKAGGLLRLELPGADPSSVRAIAGEVASAAGDSVTLRLRGTPGERVVVVFRRP